MALLVPNVGEAAMLSRLLGNATGDVVLHLYSNNYTPIETSVVGGFTECVATGYAAKTLAAASWSIAGDPTEASFAEQDFAVTSAMTAYGYYVTDVAGTTLLWAELFTDGPYTIPTTGSVFVTPKIQLA